jgi:hypothetical protein
MNLPPYSYPYGYESPVGLSVPIKNRHISYMVSIIQQIYKVFGLMNHSIQNEVMHHGSIPQIWWDESIPHISTKQLTMRNEVVMD